MKYHKFEEINLNFGYTIHQCVSCEAISVNSDLNPFSDQQNWKLVSIDCNKAFKQIELINRRKS